MAGITKAQINDWKKTYGDLYEISVEDKKAYFKMPDRNTLSLVMSLQKNPMKANEALAVNCFVGGDRVLLEDDQLFFATLSKLVALLQLKEATLKKL